MQLSGRTPLFRARNLEKHLGVESIYLKLEGSNPSGHKNDRVAEALVRYAITKGYEKILIHGSEQYIKSVLYFANKFKLTSTISLKRSASISKYLDGSSSINSIKIKPMEREAEQEYLESYAKENHMLLISEWDNKPFIRTLAIQGMMEEALNKLPEVTDVWTQIIGGFTVKSIYHEIMRSWIKGNIEEFPTLSCGVSADSNFDEEFIYTSKSKLIEVSSESRNNAVKLLKSLENITISSREAYSIAAFLECSDKRNGAHIIILNDGKSEIIVNEISKQDNLDVDSLVKNTRKLLQPYNDSVEETRDAIYKAINSGFIFTAARKDELHGICIVVNMGFEKFIPTYHLAYIGVRPGNAGRGVATELINMAVEKTQGKLSLHVDIPNKRAKKLYEKMGFVHCYDRMIYKD